jgi:PPP family 3-phenylpropionic acid transporter
MSERNSLNIKHATFRYSVLNIFFWLLFLCVSSYAGVYLESQGFSGSEIGLTIAGGDGAAVILQQFLSSLADRSRKVTLTAILLSIIASVLLLQLAVFLAPLDKLHLGIIYAFSIMLMQNCQSLLNGICVYYLNRGADIQYGFGRGIGSFVFALASFWLGIHVAKTGTSQCTFFGIILCVVLLPLLLTMRTPKSIPPLGVTKKEAAKTGSDSYFTFCRKNPEFMQLVLGMCLIYIMHLIINSYAIQIVESLGGNSAQMGIWIGIAAIVEFPAMALYGTMEKKVPCTVLLMISTVGFTVKSLLNTVASTMPAFYVSNLFQFIGFALFMPASVSYINHVFGEQDKNKALGLMISTSTIGGVIGNIIGGRLIDTVGVRTLLWIGTSISAVGTLIAVSAIRKNARKSGMF